MTEKRKNLAASIRAKLTNIARERGEELQNLLMRFAAERFLYRISVSEHKDKFLLKGAALFSFWFNEPHRPTKDLDLLGFGKTDVPTLEKVAREICRIDGKDGLEFLPETVKGSIIREEEIYGGIRLNLLTMLEKARIPVQIDVGSGDAVTPEAKEETLPTILDLLPAPRIRIYPKETVVAEKFEAMVKLGIGNSRMKDFWDIAYLIKEFEFDGELLQRAIRATFTTRQTPLPHNLPLALTDEFAGSALVIPRWNTFVKRNRITTRTNLISLIGSLREFFAPVIEAETRNAVFTKQWQKEGKWKE
jgi:predicted nucleotidyltransferase component of viral defense system